MRIATASIALLGLPLAMAAILPIDQNANPTRPKSLNGLSEPSPQPGALGTLDQQQEDWQEDTIPVSEDDTLEDFEQRSEEEQRNWWHDLLRRAAGLNADVTSRSSLPVHNTFTNLNKSNTPTITAAPSGTEVAVFTAAGAVFTVTEVSGHARVDGKSLVPGGPGQLIAGEYISEGSSGAVFVNGETLAFEAFSSSSQAPPPARQSSSSAAAASSSASAGGGGGSGSGSGSTSSSSGDAVPLQTQMVAVKVVAVVGALAGAAML